MPTFEQAIEIQAEPEALFDLTQDYSRRLEWDPFLKVAELHGEAPGVGVRAWCVAWNGLGMETEYISFNRPKGTAVKMTRGPRIISAFAGSWRFQVVEPGRTRVIFRYHVSAAPRWLGFLFDPIMRMIFTHEVHQRLAGLKRAAETTDILQRAASVAS
jgi:ribosome-associated toxin RatA of RatAB toxin-antitoxin module